MARHYHLSLTLLFFTTKNIFNSLSKLFPFCFVLSGYIFYIPEAECTGEVLKFVGGVLNKAASQQLTNAYPNLVKNHTQGFGMLCKRGFKDPNGNLKGCEKVDECQEKCTPEIVSHNTSAALSKLIKICIEENRQLYKLPGKIDPASDPTKPQSQLYYTTGVRFPHDTAKNSSTPLLKAMQDQVNTNTQEHCTNTGTFNDLTKSE